MIESMTEERYQIIISNLLIEIQEKTMMEMTTNDMIDWLILEVGLTKEELQYLVKSGNIMCIPTNMVEFY